MVELDLKFASLSGLLLLFALLYRVSFFLASQTIPSLFLSLSTALLGVLVYWLLYWLFQVRTKRYCCKPHDKVAKAPTKYSARHVILVRFFLLAFSGTSTNTLSIPLRLENKSALALIDLVAPPIIGQ